MQLATRLSRTESPLSARGSEVRHSMYCPASRPGVLSFQEVLHDGAPLEESRVIRILVVDDNPAVRRYLRSVLEQHGGWRVCDEARNGQEAVERFRQVRPDVVVLDFQMPGMNGLDAARIISQLSPDTPILMVTLYLSKQLSEEARKVGIRGACTKTDIGRVVDAVGALLREETYFPN
jgi:DNA-binding NarL/FixJ family response regulator